MTLTRQCRRVGELQPAATALIFIRETVLPGLLAVMDDVPDAWQAGAIAAAVVRGQNLLHPIHLLGISSEFHDSYRTEPLGSILRNASTERARIFHRPSLMAEDQSMCVYKWSPFRRFCSVEADVRKLMAILIGVDRSFSSDFSYILL